MWTVIGSEKKKTRRKNQGGGRGGKLAKRIRKRRGKKTRWPEIGVS